MVPETAAQGRAPRTDPPGGEGPGSQGRRAPEPQGTGHPGPQPADRRAPRDEHQGRAHSAAGPPGPGRRAPPERGHGAPEEGGAQPDGLLQWEKHSIRIKWSQAKSGKSDEMSTRCVIRVRRSVTP